MADIHTGIGGWTFPPWRRTFYPDALPHAQELAYAGQRLTRAFAHSSASRASASASKPSWS